MDNPVELSRDDLKLALEHDRDMAAVAAQNQKVRALHEDEKRRVLAHQQDLKTHRKELARLQNVARRSGLARRQLKLAVPQELRDAADKAEREHRAHQDDLRRARRTVRNAEASLAKLQARKVDKPAIDGAKAALTSAVAALRVEEQKAVKLSSRVSAASKATHESFLEQQAIAAAAAAMAAEGEGEGEDAKGEAAKPREPEPEHPAEEPEEPQGPEADDEDGGDEAEHGAAEDEPTEDDAEATPGRPKKLRGKARPKKSKE